MTDDGPRPCPAPGCPETIPLDRFACRKHWISLPMDVRRELVDAWNAIRSGDPLAVRKYELVRSTAIGILRRGDDDAPTDSNRDPAV